MKITKAVFTIIVFFSLIISFSFTEKTGINASAEQTISISGAFALYPLAVKWGEEYKKVHPEVRFDISAGGAGKGIADALGGMIDLGAVSREIYPEEIKKGAFAIAVAKDAVVPTANAGNPNVKEIAMKGLKKSDFKNIFISKLYKNWKQAGFSVSAPIHVYTRSDASGAGETWAKYLDKKQEDIDGVGVFGDPGLLQAVKKDLIGIGYNNIAYAFDSKTKKQLTGIIIIPIDVNENGKIDADENFYNTQDALMNAIGAGKYPSPPARDLFFVSKNKPQKKVVVDFLKWVLTEGQKYVTESGYIALPKDKLANELGKL